MGGRHLCRCCTFGPRTPIHCFGSPFGRDLVGTVANPQHLGQLAVEQVAQALGHGMFVKPPLQPPLCFAASTARHATRPCRAAGTASPAKVRRFAVTTRPRRSAGGGRPSPGRYRPPAGSPDRSRAARWGVATSGHAHRHAPARACRAARPRRTPGARAAGPCAAPRPAGCRRSQTRTAPDHRRQIGMLEHGSADRLQTVAAAQKIAAGGKMRLRARQLPAQGRRHGARLL